jgi:hypothetical protein
MPYAFCAMHVLASECRTQIKGFRKYLREYDAGEIDN